MSDNETHAAMIREKLSSPIHMATLMERMQAIQGMSAEEMLAAEKYFQEEQDRTKRDSEEMWVAAGSLVALRAERNRRDAEVNLAVEKDKANMKPPLRPDEILDIHHDAQVQALDDLKKIAKPDREQERQIEMLEKVISNHEQAREKEQAEMKEFNDRNQEVANERQADEDSIKARHATYSKQYDRHGRVELEES